MNKKILAILFAFLTLPFFAPRASAATVLNISPANISVKQGQTFKLTVGADPGGVNNYTVKISIKFPEDLLELKQWNYSDNWMPLRQSEYEYVDADEGEIIYTAGYPGGFSTDRDCGTLIFLAKKAGTATVEILEESMVLDENNNSVQILTQPAKVVIKAAAAAAPTPASEGATATPVATPEAATTTPLAAPEAATTTPLAAPGLLPEAIAPEKLFDIDLALESVVIKKSSDLAALMTFEGPVDFPILVSRTFAVFGGRGQKIYEKGDDVLVETGREYRRQFADLDIPDGSYILKAFTLYNDNVKDEFYRVFTVQADRVAAKKNLQYLIIALLAALILLLAAILFLRAPPSEADSAQDAPSPEKKE